VAKKKDKPRKENVVVRYLRDTRAELRKVHWPTRQEAWNLTKVVLVVTISMALFLGLLDYLFDRELGGIISRSTIAVGVAAVVVVAGAVAAVIMGRQSAR
jgi:preprotein translocase subunit SecE